MIYVRTHTEFIMQYMLQVSKSIRKPSKYILKISIPKSLLLTSKPTTSLEMEMSKI